VNDEGQITGGGFGIKEMRICAAWLRGWPLGDTLAVEEKLKPPLLQPMTIVSPPSKQTEAVPLVPGTSDTGYSYSSRRSAFSCAISRHRLRWKRGSGMESKSLPPRGISSPAPVGILWES